MLFISLPSIKSDIDTQGISPSVQYFFSALLGVFPILKLQISENLHHFQPSGNSNNISSLISGNGFSFFITLFFINCSFSAFIFSKRTLAGSSFSSCGTNLPCIAS